MNTFNKTFNDILHESVLDMPRNSLDPTVFEFPENGAPIMHPIIKTQIINDIEKFKELVHVVVYFCVGSILTKNYSAHSDIDINVQIDVPDDVFIENVFTLIRRLNGSLAIGTTHPINYYIIQDDYDMDKTDAAYDIANETWIKEPEDTKIDTQKYMDNFQNTINGIDFSISELHRDIIDYESLKEMDTNQIKDLQSKTNVKLEEIEDGIETLVRTYKNVTTLRKQAFDKDMSPTEIRKYGKKNKLPENVTYKLLERYYYFEFIKQLKHILDDGNISDKEVRDVKKAGRNFWK